MATMGGVRSWVAAVATVAGVILLLSGGRTLWAGLTAFSIFGTTPDEARVQGIVLLVAGFALLAGALGVMRFRSHG